MFFCCCYCYYPPLICIRSERWQQRCVQRLIQLLLLLSRQSVWLRGYLCDPTHWKSLLHRHWNVSGRSSDILFFYLVNESLILIEIRIQVQQLLDGQEVGVIHRILQLLLLLGRWGLRYGWNLLWLDFCLSHLLDVC